MVPVHRWDLSPAEARELQEKLAEEVRFDLSCDDPELIAGVDVAYDSKRGESVAAACVLDRADLRIVDSAVVVRASTSPYIPGLLSFREVPPLLAALAELSLTPDLIFVDGHGRAHPRRFGIACHLGYCLQKPTIGIGKSRLCGEYEEPGSKRCESSPLTLESEVIGCVLRTRTGVKPIFVSAGYGLPLPRCVELTLSVSPRFRIPNRSARLTDWPLISCWVGGEMRHLISGKGSPARDLQQGNLQ